ncbi:hypothetical protein [Halomontanus rarus]|uniref:hypothetical protein n=1 Tax=Halomontanus rarus TaxID=3034020 RepID=UPI0023E81472|nr:hypothetical protein [Halovivax sp. TS33]
MIDVQSAVIAALSVIIVLGLGYWLWMRRSKLNGDSEAKKQTQEELRLESDNARRSARVGFTTRARVQPTTTLLFFACVVAFFGVVLVGVYQVAKTGSPQEMAYADQIEFAISGLLFLGTGIWFAKRQDRQAGELNITYEGEQSNASETKYYDRDLVQPLFDDTGDRDALLVPIYKSNRILGLFWSPKLSADDPKARDIDKNLPEDQVLYEVPLDQSTTWDQDKGRINVRAKDDSTVSNPQRRATYEFIPSDRKSDAEIQDIKDEREQLREQLKHERRLNGIQTEQLEELGEALENRNHGSLEHLDDSLGIVVEILQAGAAHTDAVDRGLESLNSKKNGDSSKNSPVNAD